MLSSRGIGTAVVLAGLVLHAGRASACYLEPTLLHRIDPELARVDTVAPGRPVVVAVEVLRRSGLTCGVETCVENSCGDTGTVLIDLAPTSDDRTPSAEIGYRLEWLDGVVPQSMRELVGVNLAGRAPLLLRPSFAEVLTLDATLRVVAIDAAGNESPPSEPFELEFDGCTLAAVGDQCEHEFDADAELASPLEGAQPSGSVETELVEQGASCSAAPNGASAPSAAVLSAGGCLAALLGSVARRRRR
jgi:hypothetical protein